MTSPILALRAAILAVAQADLELANLMGGTVRLYDEPPAPPSPSTRSSARRAPATGRPPPTGAMSRTHPCSCGPRRGAPVRPSSSPTG